MSIVVESLVDQIGAMSVGELVALTKRLQDVYDVVPVNQMILAIPGDVMPEPEVEEQLYFDVVLTAIGDRKIQVIKVIREITKLGLKEAKDLVDQVTVEICSTVITGQDRQKAEEIQRKLEAEGATVVLR